MGEERRIDLYRGHICVTVEPGCTCQDHAEAMRERDALAEEVQRLQSTGSYDCGYQRGTEVARAALEEARAALSTVQADRDTAQVAEAELRAALEPYLRDSRPVSTTEIGVQAGRDARRTLVALLARPASSRAADLLSVYGKLSTYVKHANDCPAWGHPDACSCGLADQLQALRALSRSEAAR